MSSYYEKILATGEVKCIDEDIPFEIPQGWEWCRLNDLALYRKVPFGSSLTKSMFVTKSNQSVKVYEQKNAIQKDFRLGDYYISKEKFEAMQSFIAKPNDIIVSCAGTIGETYLLPLDAPIGIINQALMRVSLFDLSMAEYWQMYFAYMLLNEAQMKGAGSAIKNIPPFEYLKAVLVPVPPLSEQNRLVERYNLLLSLIVKYESEADKLNCLNLNIYDKLKKTVLQEAIQGKLVPQIAEEGSAQDLLEQIKEEKRKLVKEGKLKKSALNDSAIFRGDDNKSIGTMMYNGQRTNMMVKPHKRSITEDFQMSHTTAKGNIYNVDSYWTYSYLPGQLLTIGGMTERLNLGFFSTQNEMQYKLKVGRHYLNNELGVNYDYQSIGVAMDEEAEKTNVYQLLRTYWTPSMSFLFGKHRIGIKSKISYAHQSYRESRSNHLWIDPSVSWNWKATVVSEFSANVGYANAPLMGRSIYDTPIFTSYRTQKVNRGKTDATHSIHATAAYKYTNPVSGLFFNIRPSYNRMSGNILYESAMNGNVYTMTATDKEYIMQTIGVSGRISKSFGWAKTLIGLGASHNITDYSMLVSGIVNDARMNTTSVSFNYSLRPARFLSVEGKSNVNIYKQKNLTASELSSDPTTDWEHFLKLYVFPAKGWMLSVKNELFHTNDKSIGVNHFLDHTRLSVGSSLSQQTTLLALQSLNEELSATQLSRIA